MLIYAAANQGRSSTSFIILRCQPASAKAFGQGQRNRMKLVLERPCS